MLKHSYIKWIFIVLIFGGFVTWFFNKIPLYVLISVLIFWLILTVWASFDMRMNYFVKTHSSNKKVNRNVIALTFDDGPTEITPEILNLLEKFNQKATFFCIGKQVEKYPEIAKRLVNEGHTIANHTWSHTNKMGFLPEKDVVNEIVSNQKTIKKATGKECHLFRPPFGVTNPNIAKACNKLNLLVIGWNIRSLDTVISSKTKILNRIIPRIKKGSVILLHDTSQKTADVLEQLLIDLKEKEFQSVPVDELLQIKAYKE